MEEILKIFPSLSKREFNYIKKFNLSLNDIICINPDCKNLKKLNVTTKDGFQYCCSKDCRIIMKEYIKKNGFEKGKQTYKDRTGYLNPSKNPESLKKRKETVKIRYGIHPLNSEISKQKSYQSHYKTFTNMEFWGNKEFWEQSFIIEKSFALKNCMKFFNCGQTAAHKQASRLGINYLKNKGVSNGEKSITDFIAKNYDIITNSKNIISPKELDIFIPTLNIAIEYNGLFFHSYHSIIFRSEEQTDLNYSKYRHQNKSLACIKKGIRLLHIYEDEDPYLKIEEFLNWKWDGIQSEFDLDSGCYPLGIEYKLIEPESRIVLKDRILWNAGRIKLII